MTSYTSSNAKLAQQTQDLLLLVQILQMPIGNQEASTAAAVSTAAALFVTSPGVASVEVLIHHTTKLSASIYKERK